MSFHQILVIYMRLLPIKHRIKENNFLCFTSFHSCEASQS